MVLPAGRSSSTSAIFPTAMSPTRREVEAELERIGHTLTPLEIVLVNTSAGARIWPARTMSPRAAAWGARRRCTCSSAACGVTGTDGWSWDAPFVHTTEKYLAETMTPSLIWEGHKAGREIGYCHIEKLHNLEALPANGFTVSCFPVKVRGGSAGWTRGGRHHRRNDSPR